MFLSQHNYTKLARLMLFFCLQSLDFQGVQGIFTCEV